MRASPVVPLVRCECQQGIAKWKAEQSTPRREPIAEATDPSTLPMIIVASDVPDLGVANTVPELWDWCNENRERLRRLRGRLGEPAPASVATDEFRIVPEIVRQCRGYLLGFGTKDIPDRFAFANLPQDQTPTGPEHFPSPMEGFLAWASACRAPQHGIIKLVGEVEDFLTWSMAWVKERSEGRPASTEARRGASAMDTSRTQVFVSYSHKDKDRLEEFKLTLKPAISPDMLWDDTKIKAGAKWREEIRQALARARIAVLLVSSHFLASDFIANHELPPLLDEAERGGLTIFWVPVSASMYQETAIAAYQAAHDPAQPLDTLGKPKRNNAWVAICKKLMAARDEAS